MNRRGQRGSARSIAGQFALWALLAASTGFPAVAGPDHEAFITNQIGDSLSVVDLDEMKAVTEVIIGGRPAGIALSPDKAFAYLTAPESKELVVFDTTTRAVTKRIAVGQGPLGIAVHPIDGRVLVADWYTHRLYSVDPAKGAVTGEVEVGQSPSGVAVTR